MFDFLLATNLFFIVGYTFSALVLLVLWTFLRKRLPIKDLAAISNTAVAFYALCWVLLCIAAFIRVSHMSDFGKYRAFLLDGKFLSCLIITIIVAVPALRKRPLWLLIPISLALNYGTFIGAPDTTQILRGLESQEPLVLLVVGALYCLLLFLLYLLAGWAKRLLNTPSS